MQHHYKCTVAYDGSQYNGWQHQSNTHRTIQDIIEGTLTEYFYPSDNSCCHSSYDNKSPKHVSINGSGRTDAGVHALGQCFDFYINRSLNEETFLKEINHMLPNDIRILSVSETGGDFHARKSALEKIYFYLIDMRKVPGVFTRKYAYPLHRRQDNNNAELNIDAMKAAAKTLCGTHDFSAFTSEKRAEINRIRTIYSIKISVQGNYMILTFNGNGFLYNMVRILTGTLIEVGLGKIDAENITKIIEGKNRELAGFTAPANALFLAEVIYPPV